MSLQDGGPQQRIERAGALAARLQQSLSRTWRVETWLFGAGLRDARDTALAATADRSDLGAAVSALASRLAPRGLAGLVVLSDGARTDAGDLSELGRQVGVPVVTIGIGAADASDIAVRGVTAGQSTLDASLVDVTAAIEIHGIEAPFDVRLLQDGRLVERRAISPAGGAPLRARFTVVPDRAAPTVYTVDVPPLPGELTPGNNRAAVLVDPPGRRRRILVLQGAPGFEHSFLIRAWSEDPSLDLDSVVRKGRDEQGDDTYFVQAAGARAEQLSTGFPASRRALFAYDAVVLANFDVRMLKQGDLEWLRDFVGVRGGGLLALGARSFNAEALEGTPIEPLLPLRPAQAGSVMPASAAVGGSAEKVRLTDDGLRHQVMRIGATDEESGRRWAALPPLAGHVRLGAPRPGASILAVADGPNGSVEPIFATERFGAGRSLVFAGEASWHWKMMLPASDGSYDRLWRQAARWLTAGVTDPVALDAVTTAATAADVEISSVVRDAEFAPVSDATVRFRVTRSSGAVEVVTPTLTDPAAARFSARVPVGDEGISRVAVEASRGAEPLGQATGMWLARGIDAELADPRLDRNALSRLAEASGGAYLDPAAVGDVGRYFRSPRRGSLPDEWRDAWNTPWVFLLIVGLVSVEWALRRQWGLK